MTGNEALPKNVEAAISAFAVAAEKGFAEAQLKLGTLLYATEEYKEAMYWFRKAAEQGLAGAQFNLGVCYLKGHGTEQNRTQAVIWIKKAAEQGSKDAKNALAVLEEEETENKTAEKQKEIDYSKLSVDDLRKLAEQGDARVQCRLGLMYFQGEGVKQDYAEAEKWYRKAAEQGHATVQYSLGVLYFQGEGVKQDYAEAAKWFRKAAEQGDADAQRILGLMYFKGEGVKQDYAEAAKWFRKAAKQGNADAQRILCGMSFDKKGGVSVEEVIEWMPEWVAELAAQEGGKPTGGYSGGGNFEIDQAAAEKAKHDAKFREKVENVQRQIKRIDQEIAAYQKDRQRADNSRRNAGDKSFSPLEKNKSDYAHDMKKAEDKIRELEKEKKRLLDTLK
ncbi:hypothetical protein FACS189443_5830 [Planctomycetales bacterium]|nr:hypothetical protein FACS189443_5830 [Planctomycetales bacterium]